jgi:hypothetical protein
MHNRRTTNLVWIACSLIAAQGCNSDSDSTTPATSDHDAAKHSDARSTPPVESSASAGSASVSAASPNAEATAASKAFDPKPPSSGYTRLEVPVVKDLAPGSDATHCQYIQAPLDHDVDILDVEGFQSAGGHHAVAYASTSTAAVGTSRLCNSEDNLAQAGFLGGIGGEGGGGVKLPEGVAFRLPKGQSIMLNTHFLNTTDKMLDGQVAIDFKFVEVDGKRTIASLFNNGHTSFNIAPHMDGNATAECTLPRDFQFVLFTNHMHGNGTRAMTELVHPDGRVELVHEDAAWTAEMQFKAEFSHWPLEQPLMVAKGDTLRTRCEWQNPTDAPLAFPSEMCFGTGFFLSDGSSAPVCLEGSWLER